jgi:tetratricopeptide (TPR) repeat protein
MTTGHATEAEPYLKTIAGSTPGPEGKLMLADYYISRRQFDQAHAVLEPMSTVDAPGRSGALIRLAGMDLAAGNRAAWEERLKRVLAKEPRNLDALTLKAQGLLSGGKLDEALTTAQAAVAADGNAAQARFTLGKVYAARSDSSQAIAAYTEALRLNPRMSAAEVELARVHLASGRVDQAEKFARSATQKFPQPADAHLLLARVNLAKGNLPGAEASLKILTTALPDNPAVLTTAGLLQIAKKNRPAARAAFEKALAKKPGDFEALAALSRMDLEDKRPDAAIARVDAAVSKAPRDARLLLLSSSISGAVRNPSAQEKTLRQAIEVDPNSFQAYGMLAQIYVQQHRLDDAITDLRTLATKQPHPVGALTTIGLLLQVQNRKQEAEAQYQKVIDMDSNAAVAANNLAWLQAERGANLDVALRLAQTAKAALPAASEVDDTLGWIYTKKGLNTLAVASLQQAVARKPTSATYHYHLGMAYAGSGEKIKARTSLQKALSMATNFEGADNARQMLTSLK